MKTIEKTNVKIKEKETSEKIVEEEVESPQLKRIRFRIYRELENMGFNLKHSGTKYLCESILYVYDKEILYIDNLKKDIYPIVAKKFNKTVDNIKNNIGHATDYMFVNSTEENIINYFGFYDKNVKPNCKRIMYTVLRTVRMLEV